GSHRLGDVGTGIAYKPVSENSAHLLLSSHGTASWNLPDTHWFKEQHDLLINSMNYLIDDAVYGQLKGEVASENGEPLEAKIEVRDTGVSVEADENGEFTLHHDEGLVELEVRLAGYKTEVVEVDFSHEKALKETFVLRGTEGGQVSGIVTDAMTSSPIEQVDVTLYDSNKELVGETVTASNGYYEFTGIDSGEYEIKFKHEDYVL